MGRLGFLIGAAAIVAAIAVGAGVAWAAHSNDDLRSATRVREFPFANRGVDTTRFTLEAAEPRAQCLFAYEPQFTQTAWFRIDVDDTEAGWYKLDTRGSTYDTVMVVYRAMSSRQAYSSLREEVCVDDTFPPFPTSTRAWVHWELQPGTYYVRIGDYTYPGSEQPHTMDFTAERVDGPYGGIGYYPVNGAGDPQAFWGNPNHEPPRKMHNDNIKQATSVRTLPFVQSFLDVTAATLEAAEPMPTCFGGATITGSVWYRIEVPAELDGPFLIQAYGSNFPMRTELYRSSDGTEAFGALTPTCTPVLEGGGVYYLQVGALAGATLPAQLELSLSVRPLLPGVYP